MFETFLAGFCFLSLYTLLHDCVLHQMLDASKVQHPEKHKSHAS
jgi:hypothetical protein